MLETKVYVPDHNWTNQRLIEIFSIGNDGRIRISDQAEGLFSLVSEIRDCDWVMVPAFVSGLQGTQGKDLIRETSALAASAGKNLGFFSNSDLIVDPGVTNGYIFTPGSYKTLPNQVELPALLPYDPVERWKSGQWSPQRRISLGFCGQATQNPLKTFKDFFKIESMRLQKKKGKSPFLHIPRFLPAYERSRVLSRLGKSKEITTDFVLRSHYKAGATTQESILQVEKEFFDNIDSNLFTLCIRGMGNYSVRFYQTLAMGRIPVWIDTDGVLPFASHIDYSGMVIRVPFSDRFEADRYILDFLDGKTQEDLDRIQARCRAVWLEHFRLDGMLRNLSLQLKLLPQKSA